MLEITVVLDDAPTNEPGTVFTNTAKWSFGRLIDGVFYEPLPGEWGDFGFDDHCRARSRDDQDEQ